MLSINTNLSSMIAQNSMNTATAKLDQAIERMTTGYKINHAKDNAAGYSINTNLTTKLGAYDVAQDNAEMGLDMVTTAEENLSQMGAYAKRLRELATQARNGTYGKQSLQAMQEEANAIYAEINRLYQTAEYNGVKLFNQSEYDLPDTMPKADPITGFIEDPYDYTEEDLENITSIAKVKNNTFEESTYKIETVADLVKLAELTNAGVDTTGKTFVLANDLDLKEYCENHKDEGGWTPIGTETNEFKGTFNGNGNVISNLTINRTYGDYQGLFGYSQQGSKIYNIGIENADITGNYAIGILSGFVNNGGTRITNCYATGNVKGYRTIGGLLGYSDSAGVSNCYVNINLNGNTNIGGLIGYSFYSIENCYAKGSVMGENSIGGLIGQKSFSSDAKFSISNCYTICEVKGKNYVGGLIGDYRKVNSNIVPISKIENSASFSTVKGDFFVGSFIGILRNNNNGTITDLEINNCKTLSDNISNIGDITDTNFVPYDYHLTESYNQNIKKITLNTSTNLQVGIKAESASQIDFDTNFELDLGKIVRNGIRSDSALSTIDNFIDLISAKETELGAISNRLESVLDEIEIQYNNLASSRSTIRDADIAEVSSEYIKMQILQQASSTLLATANQTPSIALQLI